MSKVTVSPASLPFKLAPFTGVDNSIHFGVVTLFTSKVFVTIGSGYLLAPLRTIVRALLPLYDIVIPL
jgi:hypothetical protein